MTWPYVNLTNYTGVPFCFLCAKNYTDVLVSLLFCHRALLDILLILLLVFF